MNELIGRQLGKYRIVEQIGMGGMATVYKAYQPALDIYVALKVLDNRLTEDVALRARFAREAPVLANLRHPNILPIHEYGEEQGIIYLAMRYVDAGTLRELITQRSPLGLAETANIVGQVGRALGYAHNQGVLHLDVKPSNVLIDEQGNVFLTDFGMAKLVSGTSELAAPGITMGTPEYMSPEHCLGQSLDHRSDIYALGIVLYEMITGGVPYEAETPIAVLYGHVNATLPLPRLIRPDLPESVERVILRALAKDPGDRFQSAIEMVQALDTAVEAASPVDESSDELGVSGDVEDETELERDSLLNQLAQARENLRLVQERKAEYVMSTDIPLQLVKEERRLLERIEELEQLIGSGPE